MIASKKVFLPKKYTIKQKSIFLAVLLCVAGIFYYSWLPNPRFETETYMPLWLLRWSNTYFNMRTAIPFIPLGYLTAAWVSIPNKALVTKSSLFFRIKTFLLAIIVVCLAEGGQYFLKDRHPDLMDVFFGLLGSVAGSCMYHLIQKINLLLTKNA